MRIIIFTSSTNRSGGTRQALYQAKGLAERGHAVTLCLPAESTFWDLEPDPWWHRLPARPGAWKACLEGLLPASGQSIVHAFHNKAVKRLAWWGLGWGRKTVCVAHRGVIFRPHNPLPYLSPAMRAFIVNSEACAKAIGVYAPKRKIFHVPNAVPDERITPRSAPEAILAELNLDPRGPRFVYVGGNSPIKGAEPLLRAFAAAAIPGASLVTVGTTPERWRDLTETLGLSESVRHVGQVENVSDYLQVADAFVFPTSMDSAPNTLLEAVRMGLPVIATRVGGVPEIARNNGLLIPPDDADALVAALRTMAADPEQRKTWATASRAIGDRYSVQARCTALEAIYARLLEA